MKELFPWFLSTLCRTVIVYDRKVNGQILTFGVSGRLWKNALVMYDRMISMGRFAERPVGAGAPRLCHAAAMENAAPSGYAPGAFVKALSAGP